MVRGGIERISAQSEAARTTLQPHEAGQSGDAPENSRPVTLRSFAEAVVADYSHFVGKVTTFYATQRNGVRANRSGPGQPSW